MNIVAISGNLVEDVTTKTSKDGIKVVNGTLAVPRPFSAKKEIDYIPFVVVGNISEYVEKNGKRGAFVEANGIWLRNVWKDSDGEYHETNKCRVNEIKIIGKLASDYSKPKEEQPKDLTDDDLPF